MTERSFDDEISTDLFRAWCTHFDIGCDLVSGEIADDMKDKFWTLQLLKDVTRAAERDVLPKAGRPSGLPPSEVLVGLAWVYRRSVGAKPAGKPFLDFAHSCLVELGYPAARPTLADAIKVARREAQRHARAPGNQNPFV